MGMNENLEYNFLIYQIDANNLIKSFLEKEIADLSIMTANKRKAIKEVDELNRKLNIRLNQIGEKNKSIVKYDV